MKNSNIHKALAKKLEEISAAAGVPVAWENVKFTPPASGVFLEENFLPADNEDIFIQGTVVVKRGIYQITVVHPLDKGAQAAEKLADNIAEQFPNNAIIDGKEPRLFVNGFADVFSGYPDSTGYRIPVSIPYMITA